MVYRKLEKKIQISKHLKRGINTEIIKTLSELATEKIAFLPKSNMRTDGHTDL